MAGSLFSYSGVRLRSPHSFKGGFVLNFMDLSIVSLLWFYPRFQGRFVYSDFRRLVSIVVVWIRPLLAYKAWLYGCYQFVCFDLFWHKKEAAASTVCLTGFPCRFWFFPMTGFLFIFFIVITMFRVVSGVFCFSFHSSFADPLCPRSAQVVSAILLPGLLR